MSDDPLREPIYKNFSQKETDELIEIWRENKRYEWSDLTFAIIQQILHERNVEIPAQNDPKTRQSKQAEEEIELEKQLSNGSRPKFYQPQQLRFFANATSVAAWVTLAIYIIISLWRFLLNWDAYSEIMMATQIIALFSQAMTGVVYFFMLKGLSFALRVLMEFEIHSREK